MIFKMETISLILSAIRNADLLTFVDLRTMVHVGNSLSLQDTVSVSMTFKFLSEHSCPLLFRPLRYQTTVMSDYLDVFGKT